MTQGDAARERLDIHSAYLAQLATQAKEAADAQAQSPWAVAARERQAQFDRAAELASGPDGPAYLAGLPPVYRQQLSTHVQRKANLAASAPQDAAPASQGGLER